MQSQLVAQRRIELVSICDIKSKSALSLSTRGAGRRSVAKSDQQRIALDPAIQRVGTFPDQSEAERRTFACRVQHLFYEICALQTEEIVFGFGQADTFRLCHGRRELCVRQLKGLFGGRTVSRVRMMHAAIDVLERVGWVETFLRPKSIGPVFPTFALQLEPGMADIMSHRQQQKSPFFVRIDG